jgi:xylose isomerase
MMTNETSASPRRRPRGALRALREANIRRVLEVISTDGGLNQAAVGRRTGLSRATVSNLVALGIFGSVDANRGDVQNGWDTDQFPNDVRETALALHHILNAGGLTNGGFNFDAKVRRQSTDPIDLFHGHIGGIDTLAKGLLVAAELIETQALTKPLGERYADWDGALGRSILAGQTDLAGLADKVLTSGIEPSFRSGHQEAPHAW